MKRMIRANSIFEPDYRKEYSVDIDDDDWIPPLMNEDIVEDICNRIKVACQDKYGRRFKRLFVEFDDVYWGSSDNTGGRMHATVTLYANGEYVGTGRRQKYEGGTQKARGEFEFYTQDSYWEESDYEQDINRTVYEFVENLV